MIAALAFTTLTLVGAGSVDDTSPTAEEATEALLALQEEAIILDNVLTVEYFDTEVCPTINEIFGDQLVTDAADAREMLFTLFIAGISDGENGEVVTALLDSVNPVWDEIIVDYLVAACPTAALRETANSAPISYDDAYDAWLDLTAGEDLCDEYEEGDLSDALIAYVYPGEDIDAVEEVLADHC